MDIIGAKLVTKELVIGKRHKSGGIESPLLLVPVAENNSIMLKLAPYLPPVFKPISSPEVKKDHIMLKFEVPDEIKKGYVEAVTGISIVDNVDAKKIVKDIMSGKGKMNG